MSLSTRKEKFFLCEREGRGGREEGGRGWGRGEGGEGGQVEVGRGRGGRGKGQERREDPPVLPGVLKSSPAEPESLPQQIPTLPHKLELPGPSEAPNSESHSLHRRQPLLGKLWGPVSRSGSGAWGRPPQAALSRAGSQPARSLTQGLSEVPHNKQLKCSQTSR